MLIGYASTQPDGAQVAAYAAAHTERLDFLVAHRPGFVAPTLAARTFATLDQFTRRPDRRAHHHRRQRRRAAPRRRLPVQGRALRPHRRVPGHRQAGLDQRRAVRLRRHVLPGRGLRLRRAVRPAAADPAVLRRLVGGGLPGRRQARRHVRPVGRAARGDHAADRLGQRGRAAPPAAPTCRGISRLLPPDPRPHRGTGLGARAPHPGDHQGERRGVPRAVGHQDLAAGGDKPQNVGSQRLLAAAAKGELHDRALWTPLAAAIGAARQLHRTGRHAGDRRPGAARLRRHRRDHAADPRLRPVRRRHRLRPPRAAHRPRGGRQARRGEGRGAGVPTKNDTAKYDAAQAQAVSA